LGKPSSFLEEKMKEHSNLGGFDGCKPFKLRERTLYSPFFGTEIPVPDDVTQDELEEFILSSYKVVMQEGSLDEKAVEFLHFVEDAKIYFTSPLAEGVSIESLAKSATRLKVRTEVIENSHENEKAYENVLSFDTYLDWQDMEKITSRASFLNQPAQVVWQEPQNNN